MRPIKLVSVAAHCSMRFAVEECRLKRISNNAGHLVILCVVLLILSYARADNLASTAPPQVNLWYGNYQTFGTKGIPQKWINILGNVSSPVGIKLLTYSLNGTTDVDLNLGTTNPRLVEVGDFNADIDYALLLPGVNNVVITAVDYMNQFTQQTVYS